MKLKKLSSLVLATSVLIGASGAMADGIATAYLKISDFRFENAGTKAVVGTDIIFNSTVENDGDTNASLNGTNVGHSASAPATAGLLDVPTSCVGACAYVDNSFSYLTKPTGTVTSYALGDAYLTGASVNFPGLALPNVTAETLAEAALSGGTQVGSASGNNLGVQTNFTFIASATGTIDIKYSADAYVRAFLSGDTMGVQANGSINFTINVFNETTGAVVLAHQPSEINAFAARSATIPGQDFEYSLAAFAISDSFAVVGGNQYQLTIDHVSDANAEVIPEPASLAILGVGLLSMGLVRRRKRK